MRAPAAPLAQHIGVEALALTLADPVLARLDPGHALPPAIDRLHLDATVTFDAPWDRHALEDRLPQPTHLRLDDLSARWGAISAQVTGEVAVTAGVPDGVLHLRAEDWRGIVALAVGAGLIQPNQRPLIETGLAFLAASSGKDGLLAADLTLRDGQMKLGAIPLGPAPRLVLR